MAGVAQAGMPPKAIGRPILHEDPGRVPIARCAAATPTVLPRDIELYVDLAAIVTSKRSSGGGDVVGVHAECGGQYRQTNEGGQKRGR